jgi:ribonuclease P protein component
MLAKPYRLPVGNRLTPLFSYRTSSFVVKVGKTTNPLPRFGCIISKKVSAKATDRNRIRRQLISIIEELLPQIKPGYDILFIVQPGIVSILRQELRQGVLTFLQEKQLI